LLARLNAEFDAFPQDLQSGDWYRGSQRRDYTPETGLELHNAVELGGPFEELIDHPSWIDNMRHYCGEEKSYVEGLFIDESIASFARRAAIIRCIRAVITARYAANTATRTASFAAGSATSFWR
jgi:hypothetical protein